MKEKFRDSTLSPKVRAQDLLGRLTLREKVGQINQRLYGFNSYIRQGDHLELTDSFRQEVEKWGGLGVLYGLYRADPWADKDFSTGLTGSAAIRAYNLAQRYVIEHSRFQIPMLLSTECPHGHQALDGYLLPVNLAMGAAWNPSLVEDGFSVVGRQLRGMGVDFALISMLDVLRDPRWGRSEECYGEDPYLCAKNAAAAVRGCTAEGVDAVSKHFCAQGETTGGVNASAARIGERELREIHLPPMAAAAKAGARGVMAAYNEIDGVPCHANAWLLQDVLRGEMGFNGIVMADGVAIDRLNMLTGGDFAASGAAALKAGVDVSLWDEGFSHLEEAVQRGLVPEETLDCAVLRVLEIKFERGLFEHPYLEEKPLTAFPAERFPQSLELARQSAVLLKNDGVLPLDAEKPCSIAVIGPNADAIYQQLGDYTPPLRDGEGVTLLEGVRRAFPKAAVRFAPGCTICGRETDRIEEAAALAAESDIVILALGGSSSRFAGAQFDTNGAAIVGTKLQMDCGEGVDTASLELPGAQNALAAAVFAAGKPVVSVIISGRPHAVPEIAGKSDALLWAFYPGPWGGQALAEVLSGAVNPSGCLPVSVPRTAGQLPVYYNARASYDMLRYRDLENTPLFPFGFGLHYTQFTVGNVESAESIDVQALRSGGTHAVRCTVCNTGSRAGFAVVQLFIQGMSGSIVRRVRELKGFEKLWLEPGERKTVELRLGMEELGVWTRSMRFDAEPGVVRLYLTESGAPVWNGEMKITEN
ncbi:MAG: glycoside hydrolase family 3 N-terminal domain-containing protein [Hominenteromicrobium sp.]